jgi:hypothetical protein
VSRRPLGARLYQERALYELARFISYGGRRTEDVKAFMAEHARKYGQAAMRALHELTMADGRTQLTVLRPGARKACRVLLGPPPESEEYERYWKVLQERQPPAEHQPPEDKPPAQDEPPAREEAPGKRKRKKADS